MRDYFLIFNKLIIWKFEIENLKIWLHNIVNISYLSLQHCGLKYGFLYIYHTFKKNARGGSF